MLIFFIVLGIVIVPLSSYLTFRFLGDVWQNVGRPKAAVQAEVADMQILDFFGSVVSENVTAVRNSVRPAALPDIPEEIPPVTEEIPPVRNQTEKSARIDLQLNIHLNHCLIIDSYAFSAETP